MLTEQKTRRPKAGQECVAVWKLVGRVGHLETSTATIVVDVAEMKPVADDVKRWKLTGIGALGVAGIAAMAPGVSLAEAIRRIVFVIIGKA